MAEVSIWASDLRAGTLPPVCVKSGVTADSKLMFWFSTRKRPAVWVAGQVPIWSWGAHQGPLPLTKRWRDIFIALRAVTIAAAAAAVVLLFSLGAVPEAWRAQTFVFSLGALVTYLVTHLLYAGLRPKSYVQAAPNGQLLVRLYNVHPKFVAAVKATLLATLLDGGEGQSYPES